MRKKYFKLAAMLLFLIMVMAPATAYAAGVDWPQFHNTVDNNGYSTSGAPNTNNILWTSVNIGANTSSSPVIAGGNVYVYCCPGSEDGFSASSSSIACLNEATGATLWNTTVDTALDGSWSSPAYDSGMVFIGSGEKAFCLNATSGKILWSYQLHNPVVNGSPRVAGGMVFLADWYSAGSYCYCLNENTGALIWQYQMVGYCEATPAYANGDVFVNSWGYETGANSGGDNTYCLNAATGAEIWHQGGLQQESIGGPTVAGGMVFVDTYNFYGYSELAALNETTGNFLWVAVGPSLYASEKALGLPVVESTVDIQRTDSTPAYYNGMLYLCGGCAGYSPENTYCFNAGTGKMIWDEPTSLNDSVGNWTCSVAVAGGMVFVGEPSTTNYFDYSGLYALNAGSGNVVWSSTSGGSTPAVADGDVFSIQGGMVYAFGPVPVSSVTLSKASDNIAVNGTDTLTAAIAPTNATNQVLTWTSSNPAVATVVYSGTSCTVTAIGEGSATITATTTDGSNISATCAVNGIILGDVNGDGQVNLTDALMIVKYYTGQLKNL